MQTVFKHITRIASSNTAIPRCRRGIIVLPKYYTTLNFILM